MKSNAVSISVLNNRHIANSISDKRLGKVHFSSSILDAREFYRDISGLSGEVYQHAVISFWDDDCLAMGYRFSVVQVSKNMAEQLKKCGFIGATTFQPWKCVG